MSLLDALGDFAKDAGAYAENNRTTVAIVGGATILAGLSLYAKKSSRSKPGTFDIGSGSVDRSKVESEVRFLDAICHLSSSTLHNPLFTQVTTR
jgi:hypothetical protein